MKNKTQTITYPDKPHMWVAKSLGVARQKRFSNGRNNKHFLLSSHLPANSPETRSIWYPLASFYTLLSKIEAKSVNFLRVYIANYDEAYAPAYIPNGFNNHLTLIFVPVDFRGYDEKRYYIIKPDDGAALELTSDEKEGWVNNYITTKMNHLVPAIDGTYDGNQYGAKKEPSDTRSIIYSWSYFKEMIVDEVAYQKDPSVNNIPVNGIEIYFAVVGPEGYKGDKKLNKRLLIQFEYTRLNSLGHTEVFYIDDDKINFPHRKTVSSEVVLPDRYPKGAGDTGNLCPKICG